MVSPKVGLWMATVMVPVLAACGAPSPSATTKTTSSSWPTTTTTTPTTTTSEATTTTSRATTTTPPAATTTPSFDEAQLVWEGSADRRVVALTFDAGSDRGYAEEILEFLSTAGIRASFGVTGRWAKSNPDLLLRMANEGHALINHTYDHPHMEALTREQRLSQLEQTESIIRSATGATTKPYFRPPYGSYNRQVLIDVAGAGYGFSVMWTVDSLGWKGLPPEEVVSRCLAGAKPGAILLLHVGAASTDFAALPQIVSGLSSAGYGFVTIAELIP